MTPRVPTLLRFVLLCCLALVGCSKSQRITAPSVDPGGGDGTAAASMAQNDDERLQGHTFTPGSDNPYFPLVPGTEYYYRAKIKGSIETETFVVTYQTKVIQGITTRVIQDDTWLDGVLIEHTFDWFAQDEDGNVWYFGEDVTNYDPETGAVDHDGSWEAGNQGAQAGIIMLAHPAIGDSYDEENAPNIAQDHSEVLALDAKVNVPFGRFRGCLRTDNTTPLEPGFLENKFYAPGVGLVLDLSVTDKERNQLVGMSGPGAVNPKDKKDPTGDDAPGAPHRWDE